MDAEVLVEEMMVREIQLTSNKLQNQLQRDFTARFSTHTATGFGS